MESKSTTTMSCAVAMVDILGLKRLLQQRSLEDIADTVMSSFASSIGPALGEISFAEGDLSERLLADMGFKRRTGPFSILVSDSILSLFPLLEGNREDTPIIRAAGFLRNAIAICSESGIWLRGAISYGECLVSQHDNGLIAIGSPIGEAYEWERSQNWIGGMLAPSAAHCFNRLAIEFGKKDFIRVAGSENSDLLVTYNIPLKKPLPIGCPMIAINLTCGRFLTGGTFRLPPAQTSGVQDEIAIKHANTRQFLAILPGGARRP